MEKVESTSLYSRFKDLTGVHDLRVTPAGILDSRHNDKLREWLGEGHHASMSYMERYEALRSNPDLLLEGTKSIIVVAFNYTPDRWRDKSLPQIAAFAYGEDYHDVIRRRLLCGVELLKEQAGGEWRICVDSAPIFERAWAERSGLGSRCDNGLIAIPGAGTRILLAEILSTLEMEQLQNMLPLPEGVPAVNEEMCLHCGACTRSCPTGALQPDTTVDARKCLSYQTIEHRGEWSAGFLSQVREERIAIPLFGCDICQNVCPLNNPLLYPVTPTTISEFSPSPEILTLTAREVLDLTQSDFSRIFKGSPIKRAKLAGIQRNARAGIATFHRQDMNQS